VTDEALVRLCRDTADAVSAALAAGGRWGLVEGSQSQHHSDLAADRAALAVLAAAGVAVLSEESGLSPAPAGMVAVLDPLDGSTNAAQGLPWFATSVCLVDRDGPRVALVRNLASGVEWTAVRGGGAFRGERRLAPSGCAALGESLVGLNGLPPRHLGWRQFRVYGAAALDLCAVAEGVLDGWADCSAAGHGVWDYLAGWLICVEAGAVVTEVEGRDLVVLDHAARRRPVAAGSASLAAALTGALRMAEGRSAEGRTGVTSASGGAEAGGG
jgi:fructose-1,6-bisphosphatase/inositol monophosphatase family enzyme